MLKLEEEQREKGRPLRYGGGGRQVLKFTSKNFKYVIGPVSKDR